MSYIRSLMKRKPSQEVILELTEDLVPKDDDFPPVQASRFPNLGKQNLEGSRVWFHSFSPHQAGRSSKEPSDASFTPPSSLDLEWEHEGGVLSFAPLPEEAENVSSSDSHGQTAQAEWSRVSTPDSLEWDPVEAPLTTEERLDSETETLLDRIEHLSSSALRETGCWKS